MSTSRSGQFDTVPIGPVGRFLKFTPGELLTFKFCIVFGKLFYEEVATTQNLGTLLETELGYRNLRSYLCDK